jgi:hypothetical protein
MNILALESNSPGVLTEVVLKNSSSLVFTAGSKPLGVTAWPFADLCAQAPPATTATKSDAVKYMIRVFTFADQQLKYKQ